MLLIARLEKSALLSAWMRYEVAPLTTPQVKVGVLSLVALPFGGVSSTGVSGTGTVAVGEGVAEGVGVMEGVSVGSTRVGGGSVSPT